MSAPSRAGRKNLRAAVAAVVLLSALLPAHARAQSAFEQLQMLSDALNLVRSNYVDSVAYPKLARAAIDGILRSLDPHSYFMSASEFAKLTAMEAGELTTPGLSLVEAGESIIVLSVQPRGVADRAGIQAGDRLLAVNDSTTLGERAAEVMVRLSGEERERFRLTLERRSPTGRDTFDIQIRTEIHEDRSVGDWRVLDSGVGYIRLFQFGGDAGDELEDAVKEIRSRMTGGLIVDLRNNPGGRVTAAVDVASLFLEKDALVFRTDGRLGDADREYTSRRNGPFRDLPLVLLVDRGTASAAEAVAASLQDHGRARVVGRRTFGKALVQEPFFLRTGDVIWLTIARVFSPAGRMIQRDYRSLSPEAYFALAESDTAAGGVMPDTRTPTADVPSWWTNALASGIVYDVIDSVAATLPATDEARTSWSAAVDEWPQQLLAPLLARLDSTPVTPAPADAVVLPILAARAAQVRWGPEAALDLLLRYDSDVRTAEAILLQRSPPGPLSSH